jgi:hypothetical protein
VLARFFSVLVLYSVFSVCVTIIRKHVMLDGGKRKGKHEKKRKTASCWRDGEKVKPYAENSFLHTQTHTRPTTSQRKSATVTPNCDAPRILNSDIQLSDYVYDNKG